MLHAPIGDRVVGEKYTTMELAILLNAQAEILRSNEGGVTFSGGEPLFQAEFVAQVIDLLDDVHVLLDTSGYASADDFRRVAERAQLVFFDLKLIDSNAHRQYTGVTNEPILRNLRALSAMGVPFVIRVPMIPGVTDTDANLSAIAETVCGLPGLVRVDLLPYNQAAGAKYESVDMKFAPDYDEAHALNFNTALFGKRSVPVRIA